MKTRKLLLASFNQHKLEEFRLMIPPPFELSSLLDIGFDTAIPEPHETFEENAKAKTAFVFERTGIPCFADDSGLVIDALAGRPGVYSARYAGEGCSSDHNIKKVLDELGNEKQRTARFIAVIAYQLNEEEAYVFKGTVEGAIGVQSEGEHGFGYDPIFKPAGFDLSFAQMPAYLKHRISHRAKALELFLNFLKEQN